jgi:lipopolysaccharide transport protein LptA
MNKKLITYINITAFSLKYIFIILFCFCLLSVSFVTAKNFEYVSIKSKKVKIRSDTIVFEKKVVLKRNKDFLKAKKIIVKFRKRKEKEKKIIRYTALGKASLKIIEHNNILIARGDEIVYSPLLKKYVIYGNGYLKDTKNKREISGDKISIDLTQGTTRIDGSGDAPVEFIIKADE